jgi:hypothetical protein
MPRFQQDRLESYSLQPGMQPLRQWSSLQPDPIHCKAKRLEKFD